MQQLPCNVKIAGTQVGVLGSNSSEKRRSDVSGLMTLYR